MTFKVSGPIGTLFCVLGTHALHTLVPHRPLHPGCKPIGLLWPDGDWVSLPRGQRVEDHSPRRLLNISHAGGEPPLPAHRAKNDSISEHAMARPLALCASHKSGHTLSIGIARILTSGGFVSEVHTSSRFDERSHDSVHLRQRGVQDVNLSHASWCSPQHVHRFCSQMMPSNAFVPLSTPLIIHIERDAFDLITSSVLYHASGTEPWTRCRLAPCNLTEDPSCCRSCGECIAGPATARSQSACSCGLAGEDEHVAASCRVFITSKLGELARVLDDPMSADVEVQADVYRGAEMRPRIMFRALAQPVISFYGSNISQLHLHLLYRRGLAIQTVQNQTRWVEPRAMTAAVATEMLRFLLSEWPGITRLHRALRQSAWPCSLRLCLSQFMLGSASFDSTVESILERAGVPRSSWPQAKRALEKEDTHRYPSAHATVKLLPSNMRERIHSAVETLDATLLRGFFADQRGEQQGFGFGCG